MDTIGEHLSWSQLVSFRVLLDVLVSTSRMNFVLLCLMRLLSRILPGSSGESCYYYLVLWSIILPWCLVVGGVEWSNFFFSGLCGFRSSCYWFGLILSRSTKRWKGSGIGDDWFCWIWGCLLYGAIVTYYGRMCYTLVTLPIIVSYYGCMQQVSCALVPCSVGGSILWLNMSCQVLMVKSFLLV